MIHNKFRYILTLVALFAMTAGAWATDEVLLTTVTATGHTSYSQSPDGIVTVTLDKIDSYNYIWGWLNSGSVTVEASQGYTITRCVFKQNPNSTPNRVLVDDQAPFTATMVEVNNGEGYYVSAATSHGDAIGDDFMNGISSIEVYGTAEPPIKVTPVAGKTNEWTFVMPAYDVEIAPIYAPVAKWATEGNQVLAPTAIEGIYAESTYAIVTAGTVAKGQGTAMYAVTSTNQATAPALDAFSADVPTAKDITAASDVLVWYYIKGADTPDGQDPTAENTFNDSEICTTPIKVEVLSNKFDIAFKAANANTIEAGKATVTVGGAAATVTEGKLEGVKMGSEVKMTAKEGYKFKKVEAKKGAAAVPVTAITLNKTETRLGVGSTETLSVSSVTPDDATDQSVTWSSDNTSVATVNATTGEVTGVAKGTANITATANDGSGVTATCAVNVTTLAAAFVDGATIKVNFKWRGQNNGDYVQGVYNAASGTFTVSKGGNYWGTDGRAVYKVEKSGDNIIIGACYLNYDMEGMVWTFNTTNDTYTTTNGSTVNDMPGEFGLISVTLNGTDITSQLTKQ